MDYMDSDEPPASPSMCLDHRHMLLHVSSSLTSLLYLKRIMCPIFFFPVRQFPTSQAASTWLEGKQEHKSLMQTGNNKGFSCALKVQIIEMRDRARDPRKQLVSRVRPEFSQFKLPSSRG